MNALLDTLNEQQRAAVTMPGGPALVLAGPGSGKTRVLTHRIAWLVGERRVAPWYIMAVTFTNKAAREMRARTEGLLGGQLRGLTLGTFHAICVRILRREGQHIGLDPNFTIFDEGDQLSVVRQALKDLNLDDKRFRPQFMRSLISRAKNELIPPERYEARTYWEEVARRVYQRYQEIMQANSALDFDDLLMQTVLLFRQESAVLERYQERYQHILVDEFQDTNSAQYELVKLLAGRWRNLFVVGDEDQSIYRFRGADYRNVQRFREDFPEAQVFLLEKNYRSTQIILDAANAVIAHNLHRTPKRLYTDRKEGPYITVYEAYNESDEAAYVVDQIRRLTETGRLRPGDCAVMYRTNAQSRALEDAFVAAGMPYRLVGATRFYERREIKDLLAYLRLIYNPDDDVSLGRIINVPPRGIGQKTMTKLALWAQEMGMSQVGALRRLREEPGPFGARARKALLHFLNQLEGWVAARRELTPAQLLDRVLRESGYEDYIRDGTEEGEERWANIQELRNVASQYDAFVPEVEDALPVEEDEPDALGLFLQEVALVSDVDTLPEETDAPTLLTLHMAKGLEFGAVFITGLEEGLLPHARSLEDPEEMEEERRLFYVGITRAKEYLFLTHAFRRRVYGSDEISQRSRFLDDIPPSLIEGRNIRERQAAARAALRRETTWEISSLTLEEDEPQEPRPPQFSPGDRVRHKLFGEGVVVSSQVTGDDEEVTVAFDGRGVKKLLASFARLEKLPR
ncbi:MAG TPA: UvrD-helicase domain-containing protein [Caldilineae bacterium]|nr:UvrD-helicase domain-containing protein [Caldilineae bacterium]